jgi:hypothetical protein
MGYTGRAGVAKGHARAMKKRNPYQLLIAAKYTFCGSMEVSSVEYRVETRQWLAVNRDFRFLAMVKSVEEGNRLIQMLQTKEETC